MKIHLIGPKSYAIVDGESVRLSGVQIEIEDSDGDKLIINRHTIIDAIREQYGDAFIFSAADCVCHPSECTDDCPVCFELTPTVRCPKAVDRG